MIVSVNERRISLATVFLPSQSPLFVQMFDIHTKAMISKESVCLLFTMMSRMMVKGQQSTFELPSQRVAISVVITNLTIPSRLFLIQGQKSYVKCCP